jgi:hypothetical protein
MNHSNSPKKIKLPDYAIVNTPGGPRPRSKVHLVKPGQHVDAAGKRLVIADSVTGKIIEDLGELSPADPRRLPTPKKSAGSENKTNLP